MDEITQATLSNTNLQMPSEKKVNKKKPTYNDLPVEIIQEIARKLPLPDVLRFKQVNHQANDYIDSTIIKVAMDRIHYHFNAFSQPTDVYNSRSSLSFEEFMTFFRETFIPKFSNIIHATDAPVKRSEIVLKRLYGINTVCDFHAGEFESGLKFIMIGSRLTQSNDSEYGLKSTGSGESNQLYVARSFDDVINLIRKKRNDIPQDLIETLFAYNKDYG
ncbi:F-box protein [Endozoicomonas sp. SESOKO1]|uniref:F-box protein n=1 Tax=Endozoicomonas sp. SESOKO1 TaxID=2828742 RepID=UPI0021476FAD|nr:F-box protein [Endozoicomonas sp. SESOKO1]